MRPFFSPWLAVLAVPLLASSSASAAPQWPGPPATPPLISSTTTGVTRGGLFVAKQSGPWDEAATWEQDHVPFTNSVVLIPEPYEVKIRTQLPNRHLYVGVEGTLRFVIQQDTRLRTGSLYIGNDGHLLIGGASNPVQSHVAAEIAIVHPDRPFDLAYDPKQVTRGLFVDSDGQVAIFGAAKTHVAEVSGSVDPTTTTISVNHLNSAAPVVDWSDDDEIVVAGTRFLQRGPLEDELFTIKNGLPGELVLGTTPEHLHQRADANKPFHAVNLTRNVRIYSEHSAPMRRRGHFMSRSSNVVIENASFKDFGRTDKRIPLDDRKVTINEDTWTFELVADADIQNRRGRYSVHFHRNGYQPGMASPTRVEGCVAWGSPGWGFVNHGSHVDFVDNVAYDFAGSGFVTEAGNELGSFTGNVAIRGTGVRVDNQGQPSTDPADTQYFPTRLVFDSEERPQPLSDFGWAGDGFWFQGPLIQVTDNIASSCSGTGMIWFTTGAADEDPSRYVGIPYADAVEAYRFVSDPPNIPAPAEVRTWTSTGEVVLADLPILEMSGLQGYACFAGFRMRFNHAVANSFYAEKDNSYGDDYTLIYEPIRVQQEVRNLDLWNNQLGFKSRYSSNTLIDGMHIAHRLNGGTPTTLTGAEFNHQVTAYEMEDFSVDGYGFAWLLAIEDGNVGDVTFTGGPPATANYAATEWRTKISYMNTSVDHSTLNFDPASDTLTWQILKLSDMVPPICSDARDEPARTLIRYRPIGTDGLNYQYHTVLLPPPGTTTLSATIPGLDSQTTYGFQIAQDLTGYDINDAFLCAGPLPTWSIERTFTTQ